MVDVTQGQRKEWRLDIRSYNAGVRDAERIVRKRFDQPTIADDIRRDLLGGV